MSHCLNFLYHGEVDIERNIHNRKKHFWFLLSLLQLKVIMISAKFLLLRIIQRI